MNSLRDARSPQLPLGMRLADAATLDAFEPMTDGAALDWLRTRVGDVARSRGAAERGWFWGSAGCGRSHLLQAACHAVVEEGGRAIYLTSAVVEHDPEAALADLERCDAVALDDVDALVGRSAAELALFDLCNRMQERPGPSLLLFAAAAAPLACGFRLADLASRLAAATVFRIPALDDAGRGRALRRRAARRGMELEPRTIDYILARFPRDTHALFALLDDLDEASLSAQRRVTVPFVRELLSEQRR
ncbi:MAG: DnaA regulatory inactivator Hda [Pseudomonadales bacterium]|nr:DnaA regulatory inactivator Hda [Pseudomonadales bacterium]